MNLTLGTPKPESNNHKKAKDRPLSDLELEAESKAEKLSKAAFPQIPPFPGTVGFLIRNVRGGNEAVIRYLDYAFHAKSSGGGKGLKEIFILWDNLDEFSRRRVDVFDHLCKQRDISPRRFLGWITEGMFECGQQETMIDLIEARPKLISNIDKFSGDRKNFKDRELLAKVSRLTEESPIVSINQTTNIQKNTLIVEAAEVGFSDIIRNSERFLKKEKASRQITEGSKEDFIDIETFQTEREKENAINS